MIKNLLLLLFSIILLQSCSSKHYLQNVKPSFSIGAENQKVKFEYQESYHELGHLASPWATNAYKANGDFWIGKNTFQKLDTLENSRGKKYYSKTAYSNDTLMFLDYGDDKLLPMSEDLHFEKLIQTAKYSPVIVFHEFLSRTKEVKVDKSDNQVVFALQVGKYPVTLTIDMESNYITEISYLSYDELYGDVATTYIYSDYLIEESFNYPSSIETQKINGKVVDRVKVINAEKILDQIQLLEKPKDYKFVASKEPQVPQFKVDKFNDYIHFIDLAHTDDRVMIVEFDEYMLVAEAPLNSANGELIISATKKIAPTKPIKYFVFGHHHPHYLGGLRAFVHKSATILCTEISKDYVDYIANAPHSFRPDSLELEPTPLKAFAIKDSLSIGDKGQMKIYFIGEKSAHTYDYLIYYFPNDRLLFQDDLCWIGKEGPVQKAGSRQMGLYNSIIELGLQVDTIIQSWPVNNYKVKTKIPFIELEKSVQIKK